MAYDTPKDRDTEWLGFAQQVGLVVAPVVLKGLGLVPLEQTRLDLLQAGAHLSTSTEDRCLQNPWGFFSDILEWDAKYVAGAPGGPELPTELNIHLQEHSVTLSPTWAVRDLGAPDITWQLLVRIEAAGINPDERAQLGGWEATPQQRFERLLRETGVAAGLLITDQQLRLVYAPRGETSGHMPFILNSLGQVSGRPLLAGLKLLLDRARLFTAAEAQRLPAILKESRAAQANVSTELAGQVLGALHELLRGLCAAAPELIRDLAKQAPDHLYDGLLTVLMRLVFILYAEDRDLLPSLQDGRSRSLYENGYAVRGLYARLIDDKARNPDTMDERLGGWGQLLALFRLVHGGHASGFVQARGGKLFDPDAFVFLENRKTPWDKPEVLKISDGCLLRILEGLMTLKRKGAEPERLSYRTLDVEQIGSVYETIMGFTVEVADGKVLAIKAGKKNKTPVFMHLEKLLLKKAKDRIKYLKETTDGKLSDKQAKAVEVAATIDELKSAFGNLVDERASPNSAVYPAGTPVLQPTDERRRTGSHYTPRSLTAPIVQHALEPAFTRLGPNATPEQILELKVCDPAMGSAAFLVEACRALGERLVEAWRVHPHSKPKIPADEDDNLHAKRLVAQRCLYGVDRNPRAVDLAKLSLWLATLARDHEFTFLDHALKCGDSLVGLTTSQIATANWDEEKPGLSLFRNLVKDKVEEARKGRFEIQNAPDNTRRFILEAKHQKLDESIAPIRVMGDAVLSAFFAETKAKAREIARATVESHMTGSPVKWDALNAAATGLRSGPQAVSPFHWELEFPEVFLRDNGGFDAIIGNPPFAGKNTISSGGLKNFLPWLKTIHGGAHGNSDLVAHFFRRAFGLIRHEGVFGLIATNTIGQGDTRATGLTKIIASGGEVLRATRRLKWPGEAAVFVSVVHVVKGSTRDVYLNERVVSRVSAYLVEGNLDDTPSALFENSNRAFQGSIVLGAGFVFDDEAARKAECESLSTMRALIEKDQRNAERIFPFLGGSEANTDPDHRHHRFIIDFEDMSEQQAQSWPDLFGIVESRVKSKRPAGSAWWLYERRRSKLYSRAISLTHVLAISSKATAHVVFARLPTGGVFSQNLHVFLFQNFSPFSVLSSRLHETWAYLLGGDLGESFFYSLQDVFSNFPFPLNFETDPTLEAAGEAYHTFRAKLMIDRNEGLTKTYNRFHARSESAVDIAQLRALHHAMDVAVLRAYGWNDLADAAAPDFIEQEADEGKTPKTRLDWPSDFKDEVLARLLALNATRAAEERAAGLVAADDEGDEDEIEEGEDA